MAPFTNKKNGGYWESALISPVIDADGHITHFIAHKGHPAARRAAELALREERDLVAANSKDTSRADYVLTARGRIVRSIAPAKPSPAIPVPKS
ncbi:MAG: hypothetical protein U0559_05270 [Anaerolineae bacterium]